MWFITKILNLIKGDLNLKKLKKRGLKVGVNFKAIGQNIIDPTHCWHIEIGDNVVMAPRAHILAHDASTYFLVGYTRVANVRIGNNVFLGANSIVLPGVTVGDNVVVGAGAVVTNDIPSNSVVAGNPAKVLSTIDEYKNKIVDLLGPESSFDEQFTLRNKKFSLSHQAQLLEACDKYGQIFIK
jgi:maltose O-acetyltransferase